LSLSNDRRHVLPQAESALDKFKWEVANELGLAEKIRQKGWGNMTTHDVGKIGGQMVKKMIAHAEADLAEQGRVALDDVETPPARSR